MLRQEFIDEIDLTRTLREEFMAVFTEEADIMNSLREAKEELGQLNFFYVGAVGTSPAGTSWCGGTPLRVPQGSHHLHRQMINMAIRTSF